MRLLPVLLLGSIAPLSAEQGVLVLQVKDIHERAISGLQLQAEGSAVSAPTDDSGLARIRLSPQTKQGTWVAVRLVKPATDLVFISPWDAHVIVPPFDSATEVPVVLATRGDRALLENGGALASMTASVLKKIQPQTKDEPANDEQRRHEALTEVSRTYGLKPEDLDKAIRAWGDKTEDPYEKGLAALYEQRYPEATLQLQNSLAMREEDLTRASDKVAEAAFFLGKSLYEQGKYRESGIAFSEAAQILPYDAQVLNNLGLSLLQAGDYPSAEPILRRALRTSEQQFGSQDPTTALSINNLAGLLQMKGDYAGAESLYRRAVTTRERAFGSGDPGTAISNNNLARVLQARGDSAEAERLLRQTVSVMEKTFGPDHKFAATAILNLAALLAANGDSDGAEPLFRRALAIREKTLGDHPDTAIALDNLAALLVSKGNYSEAEPMFRRSLILQPE